MAPGVRLVKLGVVKPLHTHRELFVNFMMRELRLRYRRTVLGWAWSMVNPAAMTLVYSLVFSKFLRVTPPPGDPSGQSSFAIFVLVALLPWNLFLGGLNTGMASLLGSGALIQKVYFPYELAVLGPIAALGVSLGIELAVVVVALALFGYLALHLVPIVALVSLLLLLFTMGLGLTLSALNLRYRDIQHLTSIGLLVLFYLTPILYAPSFIPERSDFLGVEWPTRAILEANPLAHAVSLYRHCLYDIEFPPLDSLVYFAAWSVGVFLAGLWFFRRRSSRFAEEI
jgi:ABC-type polysaccharide/polyol phosphate export permease